MPAGRPTDYDKDVAQSICVKIAEGKALTRICKSDEMPCVATVYNWLDAHPEFLDKYVRARQDQADTYADEIIEIADDGANDTYLDEDGNPRTNYDNIQRSKLRVDARKWVASKLKPKKYGDRAGEESGTSNQGPSLKDQLKEMDSSTDESEPLDENTGS